jgi:lysophospholipase L1-like esterase
VPLITTGYSSAGVTMTNLAAFGRSASANGGEDVANAFNYAPRVLLVSYPTNDIAYGFTVDQAMTALTSIRNYALARGVPVIMLSTQPRSFTSSQLDQLEQLDARLSALAGPCFVPVRAALAGPDRQIAPVYSFGDGIHLNDAGHALIASRVRSVIDSGRCVRVVR